MARWLLLVIIFFNVCFWGWIFWGFFVLWFFVVIFFFFFNLEVLPGPSIQNYKEQNKKNW